MAATWTPLVWEEKLWDVLLSVPPAEGGGGEGGWGGRDRAGSLPRATGAASAFLLELSWSECGS